MAFYTAVIIAWVAFHASIPPSITASFVDIIDFDNGDRYFQQLKEKEDEVSKLQSVLWSPDLPKKTAIPYVNDLKGLAEVDGCYCTSQEIYFSPCTQEQKTSQGCLDRTSESYAWGMARNEGRVFWGTVSNEQCLETPGDYMSPSGMACSSDFDLNWQIPSVYMYNVVTNSYSRISDSLAGDDFSRLNDTVGLRAAGIKHGVAILAGFGKDLQHVYMFGFHAETGEFLASMDFVGYNDIRKFTYDLSHAMFVGIDRTDGNGDIYRYTGSLAVPMQFELITQVEGSPAELSFYNDYLIVGTWSETLNIDGIDLSKLKPPRMLISPLPANELPPIATMTASDGSQPLPHKRAAFSSSRPPVAAYQGVESESDSKSDSEWATLWAINEYEPDPVVTMTYGVSVNVQVGEWLYWGTVQYPNGGVPLLVQEYPDNRIDRGVADKATHRAIALFRGRNLQLPDQREVELLYGDIVMAVYRNESNSWVWMENNMKSNKVPRFGRAGFGNIYNMYLWSLNWINGYLLLGTFDSFGITELSYTPAAPDLPHRMVRFFVVTFIHRTFTPILF